MTEEKQTSLEGQLRGLSTHFNHQEKAYAILTSVAKKGLLSELEKQLATMLEKVGKTTTENVPRVFSVQLLVDYLGRGDKLYQPLAATRFESPGGMDLHRPFNTDGMVARHSLDHYDGYMESRERSDD
ncbi:MAG: hypothetical protein Q7S55_05660 [Nanoarchaeota archaeon]|nr:hypothetical protein [Nanoarchaeota archaeon]